MSEMEHKESNWSIIIVLVLVVIFGISYYLIPQYLESDRNLSYELNVVKEKITRTEDEVSNLKDLQNQFSTKKDVLEILDLAIPNGDKTDDALSAISGIAKESGVELKDIKPDSKKHGIVVANISGFYDGIKMFVGKIENNIRPIVISDFSISQNTSQNSVGQLNVNFTMTVFQLGAKTASNQNNSGGTNE